MCLKIYDIKYNDNILPNSIGYKAIQSHSLLEKCPYLELFWSVFSHIRAEYGEMLRISPYSVRMWENTNQNNCECGLFLRSDSSCKTSILKQEIN